MQSKGMLIVAQFLQWCIVHKKLVIWTTIGLVIVSLVFLLNAWELPKNIRLIQLWAKDVHNGYEKTSRLKFQSLVLQANKLLLKDAIAPVLLEWTEWQVYELPYLSVWVKQEVELWEQVKDKNWKMVNKRVVFQWIDVHEGFEPIHIHQPLDSIMSKYEFDNLMNYIIAKSGYKGEITSFETIYSTFLSSNLQFTQKYKQLVEKINKLYNAYLVKVDVNENYLFILKKSSGALKDLDVDAKAFDEEMKSFINFFYEELSWYITSKKVEIDNQAQAQWGAMQYLSKNFEKVLKTIEDMKQSATEEERTIMALSLSGMDTDKIDIENTLIFTQSATFLNQDFLGLLVK